MREKIAEMRVFEETLATPEAPRPQEVV
jgi:hypothetical protein